MTENELELNDISASVPVLGADDGQCEAVTLRGQRCTRAAAVGTLCRRHAAAPEKPTKCTCRAYKWPHRPGGGLCRWPDPPQIEYPTPAGTHSRNRKPTAPAFVRNATAMMGRTCKTVTSGRPWMIKRPDEPAVVPAIETTTTFDFARGTRNVTTKTWPA